MTILITLLWILGITLVLCCTLIGYCAVAINRIDEEPGTTQ